jgi:hypothetical protein
MGRRRRAGGLEADDAGGWIVVTFTTLSTQEASRVLVIGPFARWFVRVMLNSQCIFLRLNMSMPPFVPPCHTRHASWPSAILAVQLYSRQDCTPLQLAIALSSASNSLGRRVAPIQFRADSANARLLQVIRSSRSSCVLQTIIVQNPKTLPKK